jgi:putative ABC transport system substrate-binding protein
VVKLFRCSTTSRAGGLVAYRARYDEGFRLVSNYILKDEKAADLPVQQVSKIELVISLKTVKALGLTIPLPILGRADDVIE